MSISILNRGASGGLKPELTVTAPSGSTIDLLQNSVIVDTYTLGADETSHTFVVKIGTYTVRGTLGEQTKSVEVVIDAVTKYAVQITYRLYLYKEGDEREDVTGGWVVTRSERGYLTKGDSGLSLSVGAGDNSVITISTNNYFDITNYSKLFIEMSSVVYVHCNPGVFYHWIDENGTAGNGSGTQINTSGGSGTLASTSFFQNPIDVSTLSGNYKPRIWVGTGGAYSDSTVSVTIYNIWLE